MAELTRRYLVMPLATEGPFDAGDPDVAFVLKPWKDPAALLALEAYRDHCYPELARELDAWIKQIRGGPVVRGDVGLRNQAHTAARSPAADRHRRMRVAGPPPAKGKGKVIRLRTAKKKRNR
ncbi:MAG: hypothetical protein L0027_11810 [Candidatus Rokubacteria bacterium]|nr:hypothetical protein [Candidatus Rokubacteria bacterium]